MKKIVGIVLGILVILGIGFGVFYFFTKQDVDSTLTILEKQWIEDNKNTIYDFAVVNKIPVFTSSGEGVIYDFITDLETKTGLEFNKIAFGIDKEVPSKYSFSIKDKKDEEDILVYQDNYVLLGKNDTKYLDLKELENLNIGVVEEKLEEANKYLNVNQTLSFVSYETTEELLDEFKKDETKLDLIILPKMTNLEDIIGNYHISYNITEMTIDYVLTLGDNENLNKIFKKYYSKWYDENYEKSYNNYFNKAYFSYSNINNDTEVKFKSKQYKYGFINNEPYDKLINNKLIGINSEIIKSFTSLADVEISYELYNNNNDLVKAYNEGKIDFFMNSTNLNEFKVESKSTIDFLDEKIVILSNVNNNVIINSINSLYDTTITTLADSKIEQYLTNLKIDTKKYKSIDELLNKINKKSVIAVDYKTYEIFKLNKLKDYTIKYEFNLDRKYNYIFSNKVETLYDYYNFYLSFINDKEYTGKLNYKDFEIQKNNQILKNLIYILGSILTLLVITVIYKVVKNNKKKLQGITKENKLKYIDQLTSLKNRNYLNDNIETWDNSDIYPQSIMIVDLNNVAYINDNYGHEEGDNVITEAANILIKNQLEQTEIMRTSGNEFLIYLVGYDEKQIVAYKRKLIKECKELAHGFGAAVGYSMIIDGLKTIDDAINEATLDMRNNKEETE